MGVARGGQVLEAVIRYRWISLAPELRDGVKNYLSNLTIKLASDESIFRRDRALVSKVNVLLVQVRVPHTRSLWAEQPSVHPVAQGWVRWSF